MIQTRLRTSTANRVLKNVTSVTRATVGLVTPTFQTYATRTTKPVQSTPVEPQKIDFTKYVPSTELHLLYQFSHLQDQTVQRMKRELSNLDIYMRHANSTFFNTSQKNKVLNRPGKRLLVTKQSDKKLSTQEILSTMEKVNAILEPLGDPNNIFCFGAIHDGVFYPITNKDSIAKPKYEAKEMVVSGIHKVLLLSLLSKLVRHNELKTVTMSSLLTNNVSNTYDTL
jgi:hypothetical protein